MWLRVVALDVNKNREFVTVVPKGWIRKTTSNKKYLYWPPKNKEQKAKQDFSVKPDVTWSRYPHVKTLFSDKDKKLCEEYDISTDNFEVSSQSGAEDTRLSRKETYEAPFSPPLLSRPTSSPMENQISEPVLQTPNRELERMERRAVSENTKSDKDNEIIDLLKKVLKRQAHLEAKIDLVINRHKEQAATLESQSSYSLPGPMESKEELKEFEKEFRKNKNDIINILKLKCKSDNVRGSVRSVMNSLMRDGLMAQFNMCGKKRDDVKKSSFNDCFLKTVVVDVVVGFHKCLEEEVYSAISDHLKHAPKRHNRKRNKSSNGRLSLPKPASQPKRLRPLIDDDDEDDDNDDILDDNENRSLIEEDSDYE